MKRIRLVRIAALVGVLAVVVAATAIVAASAPARPSAKTITVWDVEGGNGGSLDALNAEFQKKFGVKVKRVRYSFGDLVSKLRLALSGPSAPDAVQLAGIGGQGSSWVKAHLLLNLDPYAAKYGWRKRFSPSYLSWGSFTKDSIRGAGSIYALGQKVEFVGVYYSKSRLAKLGATPPKTLAAFEKILAASKAAGDSAPLLVPDAEGWPAEHTYQSILNVVAGKDYKDIASFGFSRPTPSIAGRLSVAGKILQRWGANGYLGKSPASVSYNDAVHLFADGSGPFFITGTWLGGDLASKMGNDIGVMLLPPLGVGGPLVATGSESTPWGIPAKAKNKDLAAKYIDFITGTRAADLMTKNGDLPGAATKVKPAPGLQSDEFAIIRQLQKQNGLVAYFSSATPTIESIIDSGLQELMAGRKDPVEFAGELQSNFDNYVKGRR
jgi:raffinose/stachyose/melibiose transport system substrate-binding protein